MDDSMITYQEALHILAEHRSEFPIESRPLESCTGAYLAEDLLADRDFPPFDRVTMDGIAIAYRAFENKQRAFRIEATAPAGTPQKILQDPLQAIEVMTGAILPHNTDTVIRYEDVFIKDGVATIAVDSIHFKQNIHFKGIDVSKNTPIVKKGGRLSSAEINIAAAIGKAALKVRKMPKTVIISTGDELIDIAETPKPHQIRRSNIYGIKNSLQEWGMTADLAHLPDDRKIMYSKISGLLQNYEVLVFTGGVSKGKFDFLPDVLDELHIRKNIHKVQQRPGKPFWFGSSTSHHKIFALPGNPVSSFVCIYVYLRYWLQTSLGLKETPLYVKLGEEVNFPADLTYFLEARLTNGEDGTLTAFPELGHGSGDFVNLVQTDGFLILPQDRNIFKKGETYPFISYRCNC
jgi:molybdopterin molybdotransferase